MESSDEEEVASDEDDAHQATVKAEEIGLTPPSKLSRTPESGAPDCSNNILAGRLCGGLLHQDLVKSERETGPKRSNGMMDEGQARFGGPAPSVSPSSLMDTCGLSMSSLSSFSSNHLHPSLSPSSSPSSSSVFSLTPPLPPSVELPAVLTDTRLTLDVYQGGAAALPLIWGSVPDQLIGIKYLRLGSEDEAGLDGALEVLPHLTELRSLAIRASLLSLRELVIYSNNLHLIPHCLDSLPLLKIDARDNPLGQPPPPPPLPPTSEKAETKIPELHLGFSQHSFCVSSAGCHVFLPGGAELLFPPGCLLTTTRLEWAEKRPERKWVWLEEHDILLSRSLELRPHGTSFLKPVDVCVPYHRAKRREVVVRRFDGQSWSTLPTTLRRGSEGHSSHPSGRPARLACCAVNQFSWFMVVSRPVKDSCCLTPAGALLVSSSDPGIKLHFPPHSTSQTCNITLQVLHVSVSEVQTLCGDTQTSVSPLLCLSQTPTTDFLQRIKVQIPLPSGITGHTVDMSCLHLLHGDPAAQTWTDITSQVSLYVTHLYAIFYITHFSWYWLWYTTKTCVSGVVRKVYHKLKQFKVQFLVLQRKTDRSQVMLQCLPSNKVDDRVKSLLEKYDGPLPSDLCDLLEGEQFFAGFERGLDISTERPDCVGGRLCFVFYSSLKNVKEVYICPAQGHQGPVRGQVSFYRGEIPENLPEEVAIKRKGHNDQWLATLPLKLPALNSENTFVMGDLQLPPLNLGDPESGYLTESNLLSISLQIGQDWRVIGINLGLSYQELDRIQYKHRDNLGALVLEMLFHWARGQRNAGPGTVTRLVTAMIDSDRRDLAEEIEDIVSIGRRKYSESLRRVGLEGESSSSVGTPL
ncbi:p53-induced death domain-containing protein 1 isoform X2 [Antennarius striatus]|uniref:p53-induced death domain-containing protein 1 isoform X2 n=1 Tax=Antennarius striatus TaxID=241820 RepID=UPI0035B33FBB